MACAALLVGCAHAPGPLAETPRAPDAPVRELADPSPSVPAAGARREAAPDPAEPGREEGFADLLERMRAGFALPEVDDPAVRRQIAWYRRHPAYLERVLGRARRYLHHIVATLEARGMPGELALLPAIESGFDPFARSRRGAAGLWQFLPATGRHYDLDHDWWCDERRDVIEATRAASDYLSDLHERFDGDWLLAVAAYNAGSGRVRRAVERNRRRGLPTGFFHLDLPRETRAYVPRLLALARVVADPQAFGVELPELPDAPYFARVELADQVDLGLLADLAQVPREELRALNPEFRRWATPPVADAPERLLVPASQKARFEQVLADLPPDKRLRLVRHRVRPGDSLYAIARRNGIPLQVLRRVNRIQGSLIRAGQDLLVPLPH